MIDTVWWNVLGACLALGVIVTLAWCVFDARREAAGENGAAAAEPSLQRAGGMLMLTGKRSDA